MPALSLMLLPLSVLVTIFIPVSARPAPIVYAEEIVATCAPANNGAGPLWCYGSPLLVRSGDTVFASVTETGKDVPPLSNTRWRLFVRDKTGWRMAQAEEGYREREPCPLGLLGTDRLLLSVNPSTQPPGTMYGACDPHLLLFDARHPDRSPERVRPVWDGPAKYTDHSYRAFAVDGPRRETLALNIDAETSLLHWAFRDRAGKFARSGNIRFPIRACYAETVLHNRAAHVLAIGDIVEPREEWRKYEREKSGQEWDYVFRRLFYTSTPDLTRRAFAEPVEIENLDDTGGYIVNLDLWLDRGGAAHLLYLRTNIAWNLRDRFFPGQKIHTDLVHVIVRNGRIEKREVVIAGGEGTTGVPQYGRLHATPDGRLWVVCAVDVYPPGGAGRLENRLIELTSKGPGSSQPVALKEPFRTFFTTTERGGCAPSNTLDLFGITGDSQTLRYARIRLK